MKRLRKIDLSEAFSFIVVVYYHYPVHVIKSNLIRLSQ